MTGICEETRRRIRVAVAALAYEQGEEPIMSDSDFDQLCREVNPQTDTGNEELDLFFRTEFQPHTGQWVHSHPDRAGLARILETVGPPLRAVLAIKELI